MKIVLQMAITANGMVATLGDKVPHVTKAEWANFDKLSRKAGNYIMGRRTFEVSLPDGSFPYPGRLNVVMTKRKIKNKWGSNVVFTNESPKQVLATIRKKGFATAFVGGGGKLNASFIKAGLVDEIYLDIEPALMGKGISLFAPSNFYKKLKLLGVKKLSPNEIQLHYKVLK